MRLSPEHAQLISRTFESLTPEAHIYLHGSRVDDSKRGGDIDLLLLCPDAGSKSRAHAMREKILVSLKDQLGDQRIDITIIEQKDLQIEAIYRDMLKQAINLSKT